MASYKHTCEVCGKPFTSKKRKQRTCGWTCRGRLGGTSPSKRTCPCGDPAGKAGWCKECGTARKRAANRRYYARHRERIRAETRARYVRDPRYKAKLRASSVHTRERRRFNGLRQARLERDSFECQHCGAAEQLVVHHVNRREGREEPDKSSTLDDLLTLCRACHGRLHRLGR